MARIVMADDGIPFDGRTPELRPLGGAESAFISLAEALAKRGHKVTAYTSIAEPAHHKDVDWQPIANGLPEEADLYIANRGDRLIPLVPRAKRAVFWIHNPARYLLKLRYLWKLLLRRPLIVFIGSYHASTLPGWVPTGGRAVIPYGIDERFRGLATSDAPPPPRAVFTSNPLRSLDWLIELWVTRVFPVLRTAELHVFSGPSTYGAAGDAKAGPMRRVLLQAERMKDAGIVLRTPVPKDQLAKELAQFRVFTYRGTYDETFCAAAAEAQAAGVPAVVCDIGSLGERVKNRITGFVIQGDDEREERDFADAVIKILKDDALWQRFHAASLAQQRQRSWDAAAADFEKLLV